MLLSHSTFSFYNKMMLARVNNWNAKVSDRETTGNQEDDTTLKVIVKSINSWESKRNSGLATKQNLLSSLSFAGLGVNKYKRR